MSDNRYYRRGSLVWPLILISLGLVFLLNNLGVITWDIWAFISRMWPVLIVAIGLDMIFGRRSGIGAAITVILILGLLAGSVWLYDLTTDRWQGEIVTQPISQPLGDATEAKVSIKMNVGSLMLDSLAPSSGLLIQGEVDVSENENLVDNYQVNDGAAIYTLSNESVQYSPGWIFNEENHAHKTWSLALSPDLPVDLVIHTGLSQAEIDLQSLDLRTLTVESGVGEVVVYFPEIGQITANISAGVGSLQVFLPKSLAARIHLDSGLGNTSMIGDFIQHGDEYTTSNFGEQDDWVELYLDGGLGSIEVIQTGE